MIVVLSSPCVCAHWWIFCAMPLWSFCSCCSSIPFVRLLCCSYSSISCSVFMLFSFVCLFVCFILSPSCNIVLFVCITCALAGSCSPVYLCVSSAVVFVQISW